jgi:Fic family protein
LLRPPLVVPKPEMVRCVCDSGAFLTATTALQRQTASQFVWVASFKAIEADHGAFWNFTRNAKTLLVLRTRFIPITKERLFGWHAHLFSGLRTTRDKFRVGAWRDDSHGPMQVVSGPIGRHKVHYEAPKADRLEREMGKFLEWFDGDEQEDPLLKAAIAHLWFVTIHPLEDGNGRIGRAIAEMCLARSDGSSQRFYSMSSQILEERKGYYEVLEKTQNGSLDITEWLTWFLGCLDRAIEQSNQITSSALEKEMFWKALKRRKVSLNDRQTKVLNKLFSGFEGKLTRDKWMKLTKASSRTALRDIEELIAIGVIEQEEAGGRSTSYRIKSIVE